MKSSTSIKYLIGKILGLLLLFNITVLANNLYSEVSSEGYTVESSMLDSNSVALETVEVSLDMSNMGILIMIILSSLLGAFFVKDELTETFK